MAAEEARTGEVAGLLELRGRADDQVAVRHAYLERERERDPPDRSGRACARRRPWDGRVTREVARRVALGGRVVGLDPIPILLSVAREIAAQDGYASRSSSA